MTMFGKFGKKIDTRGSTYKEGGSNDKGKLPPAWERVDGKIVRKKKDVSDPLNLQKKTSSTLPQWKKKLLEKAEKAVPVRKPKLKKKKAPKARKTLVEKVGDEISLPKDKIPTKVKKKRPWWKPITVKEASKREKKKAYKTASKTTPDVAQEVVSVSPISKHVTTKDVEVKTKAGDYPVMKKKSVAAQSFRDAFSSNRKAGKKTFTWQGRSYSTRQAGEGKNFDATTGKWGKVAKKQMGGPASDVPFKQGIKYYEGGGQTTVSNEKASTGDVVHVHSHSGYKAGK